MKDISYSVLRHMQEVQQSGDNRIDAVYVYSPICGTCKLGAEMLTIVEQTLPNLKLYRMDLNTSPDAASYYEISSIPCLLFWPRSGSLHDAPERHYALHSVTHLFNLLRGDRVND